MYQKVDTSLNFVDREKEVCQFWKDNDIFQKSMDSRKEGETYTFYDGPPTANGKPHIGHVLTRVIKDMIPRYRTMKGYMVPRKAGWDTHGLPVELEVEKLLGLDGKEQIEEYGLDPFISKCKESVWKYKGMWEDFSGTVGFWADMDDPYVTYHDDFIESEWWALKQIWDKGLLYKGFKIVPYCPRCGTPLSSHEVAQGYKAVKERSAVVRFKVVGEEAYFLAWTTTPWTLPSNVALCVNPSETYVKVKAADGYTYYMAQALLDTVLGKLGEEEKPAYEVLETYVGTDLEYKEYEPLFACAGEAAAKQRKKGHYVTCDDYVTMTDGTGIVHIAPTFGEDDAQVGRRYDLPFVQFVNGKGEMTEETAYAGMFVKKADPEILKDLDKEGKLFDAPKFEHDYPFCWRCDTPLIYYARESWFIKMTAVRDDLVRNNKTVNWIPESIGEGRFGNWLENIQDWGISRNRYWGTPLNVWECEGCGHMESVGSREELHKLSGNPAAQTVELHRPYIDEITITCPDCGKTMRRVPEVIDCWFDSGAMPFAQHHYPAKVLLLAYSWPGNVRQLKNITEQISIIETNRDITAEILRNYLPEQHVNSGLPALFGVKANTGKAFESEREILYQVLFDMRRDVTDLKKLVNTLMAERGAQSVPTAPATTAVSYYQEPQRNLVATVVPATPTIISAAKPPHPVVDDIQDTEEVVEEATLSLDEVEKEMIRKALDRHHGKRKNAAKDLNISERTLYRKIKEYGLD